MMVLVTYDVSTVDAAGQKRLRKVAKYCQNYGQRVQNSVFECVIDPAQYAMIKSKLADMVNKKTDSLRFYELGSNWTRRVVHIGAKETYDIEGTITL